MDERNKITSLGREIGVRIIELRGDETQEALAMSLGVSREIIQHWERGSRHIKAEHLRALAMHFNVSTDYLLGLSDDPKRDATAIDDLGLSKEAVDVLLEIESMKTNLSYAPYMLDLLLTHTELKNILFDMANIQIITEVQRNKVERTYSTMEEKEAVFKDIETAIAAADKAFGDDSYIIVGEDRMYFATYKLQQKFAKIVNTVIDSTPFWQKDK